MKLNQQNVIIVMLFQVILTSCGIESRNEAGRATPLGAEVVLQETMENNQFTFAYQACSSLRSLRTKFPFEQMNRIFQYNIQESLCTGETKNYDFQGSLSGNTLILTPQSAVAGRYNTILMTDLLHPFQKICETVLKGNSPANYEVNSAGDFTVFTFRAASTNVTAQITYAGSNKIAHKTEQYSIEVSSSSSVNGLIHSYTEEQICNGKTAPLYKFEQIYKTSF